MTTKRFDRSIIWPWLLKHWGDGNVHCQSLNLTSFHPYVIKHQAVSVLSGRKTKTENKTQLDFDLPVLNIPHEMFAYAPNTETTDTEFIEEPKYLVVPFFRKLLIIPGITDSCSTKISKLAKFISEQSTSRTAVPCSLRRETEHSIQGR